MTWRIFWDAYIDTWRQAFLADDVMDRFAARIAILAIHFAAIVMLILLNAVRLTLRW